MYVRVFYITPNWSDFGTLCVCLFGVIGFKVKLHVRVSGVKLAVNGSGIVLLLVKWSQNLDLRVGRLRSVMLRVCRVRVCRETRIWWSGVVCGGRGRRARSYPPYEAVALETPHATYPARLSCSLYFTSYRHVARILRIFLLFYVA